MPNRIVELKEARELLLKDRWPRKRGLDGELLSYVEGIIREVRERGDKALVEFTERFDGVKLDASRLRVGPEEIEEAYKMVSDEQISAIETIKNRVYEFERSLLSRISHTYIDDIGVEIVWRPHPLESVGCYVPGGRFPYPSTLIMTVTPAKVAGVPRIVICTPPSKDGRIHPLVLVAADICGIHEIYRVGGAHAIAAMAYGTESIKPVEKIVGPGNRYVVAAKLLVSQVVPIDHPAGPSEIVILADETADPHYVTLNLISQMEHGPGSVGILVTTSLELAKRVREEITHLAEDIGLCSEPSLVVANDLDETIGFINDFAPEHLEIIAKNAHELASKVHSAGLVLIGDSTPVSISDYCLGTNHVIPTGGYSRAYSPLSVLDFVKFVCIARCPPEALDFLSKRAITLAKSEGLLNHALSIIERVRSWKERR